MEPDPGGWRTRLDASMVARFTTDGSWSDETIGMQLERLHARAPDHVLFVDAERELTVREVRQQALLLAGAFAQLGLQPGEVVSFQLPNWHEAAVVDFACCYAGLVVNPIVPIYREREVGFILANAKSRVLFVPENFRGFDHLAMAMRLKANLPDLLRIVVVRPQTPRHDDFESLLNLAAASVPARPSPNAVKLILYTSGTTGDPKGVLHTHNTVGAEIRNFARYLSLGSDDVILMPSTLCHITGYNYGIQLPVALGARAVLMDAWSPAAAAALIEKHGVSFTIGATPFLRELAQHALDSGNSLPSLRYFPTGGAPVPPSVVELADKAFSRCQAFRLFGSTEAPTVTLGALGKENARLRSKTEGFVVGNDMRLVNSAGTPVIHGEEGEICARGPELFVGYARSEDNDKAFDTDGYFHTGDLGRLTAEGCLVVTGRSKDLIIRGGENISPKEVEDVLAAHRAVRDIAVVAMPHARLGETCCAFVVLRGSDELSLAEVRAYLSKAGLAKQKWPERLEIVSSLPMTSSGKVRKNVLREMAADRDKSTG